MKKLIIVLTISALAYSTSFSQDTFSIVALDSLTGEVGSAGASCVDLFQAGLPTDDFLGQLVPEVGAINTQAWYIPANQTNATNQMILGQTPDQIIEWLIANDVGGQPQLRQYGIVGFVNGSPETAAHTGTATDDYKGHILGPNYSIQGNILLGQQVLDSMEARFLNEDGDLACKLMAALQGANMVGADSRCATNGTSSLFAFVKVAQPTDVFGSPSFVQSVRTHNGAGIEPIDSLQTKFNLVHSCDPSGLDEYAELNRNINIYPNPTQDFLNIRCSSELEGVCQYTIIQLDGSIVLKGAFIGSESIDISELNAGTYIVRIENSNKVYSKRVIIE